METKKPAERKDAVERATDMLCLLHHDEIPKLAGRYAQVICNRDGKCAEVVIAAYAHYAQLEEGLPCVDELYHPSQEDKDLFEEIRSGLN